MLKVKSLNILRMFLKCQGCTAKSISYLIGTEHLLKHTSLERITFVLRDAFRKKLRCYLGIFPKWRTPHPLFWEPLIKKLSFILHFRALGTFLTFHQKVKILPIFLYLLLGIGDKKILGQFTKVLGIRRTPPHVGKNS